MTRLACGLGIACTLIACDGSIALDPCDIRDDECRQSVFLAVQHVRGNAWDPWLDMPPTRVITADQFRDELEQAADDDPPGVDHWNVALRMLHLIDPAEPSSGEASIDASVANIAAYYDSGDKTITVIDHGRAGDLESQTFVLAHELVHAAQDRDIVIGEWRRRTTISQSHAGSALIEGEAMLYSNLVMAEIEGFSPLRANFASYYRGILDNARAQVVDAASPWYETFGLVYPLGGSYVTNAWLGGGNVAVRDLFAAPPDDVVQVFSFPGSSFDRPVEPFACAAPRAPDGFRLIRSTAMGALELFGFTTRLDLEDAWQTASTWGGDRFAVYGSDDGETLLVWQLTLGDATDLANGASELLGSDHVIHDGTQVRIMQTDSAALVDWTDWQACRPP
jgi:hypothetical protein